MGYRAKGGGHTINACSYRALVFWVRSITIDDSQLPSYDGSSYPCLSFISTPRCFFHNPLHVFFTDIQILIFSGYCVLQRSMSVSKGKSDKATSRIKDVRSTDLHFNLPLLFNVSVVGIRTHHRPQLARPLMSLILSLLLIPLFRGVYISTQLINFSIALPIFTASSSMSSAGSGVSVYVLSRCSTTVLILCQILTWARQVHSVQILKEPRAEVHARCLSARGKIV